MILVLNKGVFYFRFLNKGKYWMFSPYTFL